MAKDHLSYLDELPEGHLNNFPDHARVIGLILNEWNLVEHTLINLLAAALNAEREPVRRMLKIMRTSRARLDAIEAANQGHLHFLFDYTDMQDILDESRACLARRNRYAHAHYYSLNGKQLLMVDASEDSNSRAIERVLPLNELTSTHQDIRALAQRIWELTGDIEYSW